jgi:hypothetical protein
MFGLGNEIRTHFEELILVKGGAPSSHYSIRRAMQSIKATMLWVHDTGDKVTPIADAMKVKEDNHANLRFITTNGLGHQRIYKDEKVIDTIVDFLTATA